MSLDRYAVVGNPVAHSLSPQIHEEFARQTNQRLTYTRLEAPLDGFESIARDFLHEGGCGLSVTSPFKGDAFQWVNELDEFARESGAVNAISMSGDATKGFNTDGIGLLKDFVRLGWPIRGKRVLVLGAGGAVRGIIRPLIAEGGLPTVANRTQKRLTELKVQFPKIATLPLADVRDDWDIVINATSAHLQSTELHVDPQMFSDARCYDLAYSRDRTTPFVDKARRHGAMDAQDGLGMLVFQAACAFKLWRGVDPDAISVLESLRGS